jgi:hypothetical protein
MSQPLTVFLKFTRLISQRLLPKSIRAKTSAIVIAPLSLCLTLGCNMVLGSAIVLRHAPKAIALESESAIAVTIAQAPSTAPAELTQILTLMDAAANRRDLSTLIQFYSSNFSHGDGLNRQSMENAIATFWKRDQTLNYRTQLQSWKKQGNSFIAETVTTITGNQKLDSRNVTLKSTIRSLQIFEGNKLVKQEILSEKTEMKSGKNPPNIQFNLPDKVKVGQEYFFDAIVQEPLGDDILLGTAIEEPISEKTLLSSSPADLEVLNSGGLFKVGKAPALAENRWISAVLMRSGGMTILTQRLRVVNNQ